MRRVRHLQYCDYVIQMGQKSGNQLMVLRDNILLERTWHKSSRLPYAMKSHAKFNSSLMNGMMIQFYLSKGEDICASSSPEVLISVVDESSWSETFIVSPSVSTTNGVHSVYVPQSSLALNELSGRECYALEFRLSRRRTQFREKKWINHLGCYDHLIQLRQGIEALSILKVDD
jgi:hypothetical protein